MPYELTRDNWMVLARIPMFLGGVGTTIWSATITWTPGIIWGIVTAFLGCFARRYPGHCGRPKPKISVTVAKTSSGLPPDKWAAWDLRDKKAIANGPPNLDGPIPEAPNRLGIWFAPQAQATAEPFLPGALPMLIPSTVPTAAMIGMAKITVASPIVTATTGAAFCAGCGRKRIEQGAFCAGCGRRFDAPVALPGSVESTEENNPPPIAPPPYTAATT